MVAAINVRKAEKQTTHHRTNSLITPGLLSGLLSCISEEKIF